MINSFAGRYRFLSNFWLSPVVLDGVVYPSTENGYQAAKCLRSQDRTKFARCSPSIAQREGHRIAKVPDWEERKLQAMMYVLKQKFRVGTFEAFQLELTKQKRLIEGNTWGDVFWGECKGRGKNHLGKMLMEIRSKNREMV